jgi:hypothetical protein
MSSFCSKISIILTILLVSQLHPLQRWVFFIGLKIKLTENFARIIFERIHGNERNGGKHCEGAARWNATAAMRQGRGVGMQEAAKAPRSSIMEGGSSEPCAAWNRERHQKGKIW